jgi:hypothetical protein
MLIATTKEPERSLITCHFRLDGTVDPACTELLADISGLLAGTGVAFRLGGVEEALA